MDVDALRERLTSRDWQETEPDPDDPIRFAMVGLGWWTVEETMPAVAEQEGLETTVLVSSSEEKAEGVAEDAGLEDATAVEYDPFTEGEAADEYDAVYVCTPNALHLPYVEAAAELDKAVLCEKPLEASVERAEQLVEAAAEIPVMTAYRMHTEPAIRAARHLVREGEIGEPVAVQGHMTQDVLEIAGPDQWRLNPELAGPGCSVTDVGIYPINTARFVTDRDPVAVHATAYSEHEAFDDVPDERASFLVEYEDGLAGSYTASQRAQQSGSFRVIGTEGELRLEPAFFADDRRTLHLASGDVSHEVAFPTVDQMEEEVALFADCLRDGREMEADAEHGLVDVRAIEAVYEAAERGERVEIEA